MCSDKYIFTISNGGQFNAANDVYLANASGSTAAVAITGAGSRLEVQGNLHVGVNGRADVSLLNRATLKVGNFIEMNPTSTLELDGGHLEFTDILNTHYNQITQVSGSLAGNVVHNSTTPIGDIMNPLVKDVNYDRVVLKNTGNISGSGTISVALNHVVGSINATLGHTMNFNGPSNESTGNFQAASGEITFANTLTNNGVMGNFLGTFRFNSDFINNNNIFGAGEIHTGGTWHNNGEASFSLGSSNIHGDVVNNDTVESDGPTIVTRFFDRFENNAIANTINGARLEFYSAVHMNSDFTGDGDIRFGRTVFVGDDVTSLQIENDTTFLNGSMLVMEIDEAQFDILSFTGDSIFDGTLFINNQSVEIPVPGTTFEILRYSDRMGTSFDAINSSNTPIGLYFDLLFDDTLGIATLEAKAHLEGDADLDGDVDLGDLAKLATNFGGMGNWLQGDFTLDGNIDLGDLAKLATNFGSTIIPLPIQGPAAVNSVPHPSSMLVFVSLLTLYRRRK